MIAIDYNLVFNLTQILELPFSSILAIVLSLDVRLIKIKLSLKTLLENKS